MYEFVFCKDTATTEIYTLSLHDALPICSRSSRSASRAPEDRRRSSSRSNATTACGRSSRSEEHTSELQSRQYLVCRLLLEKKNRVPALPVSCGSPPLPTTQRCYSSLSVG